MSGNLIDNLIRSLRYCLYKVRLVGIMEYLDFVFFLNLLKHLPVPIAESLSVLRGYYRYILDMDWKSTCLGYPFMRDRTRQALERFGCDHIERKVLQRFIYQSKEEYEAKLFNLHSHKWPRKVLFENIQPFEDLQSKGKGVILLTAHFDSCIAGSTFIGDRGYNINIFYDEIVFDQRVKPFLRDFFRDKYAGMQSHYNNGTFISKRYLRDIYKRLQNGQVFIWLYDVLNERGKMCIDFLGQRYLTHGNPFRIALKTGSALGAYVTYWLGKGVYKTIFMTPLIPSQQQEPERALQECYNFLSGHIGQNIDRWWIVDNSLDFIKP